MNFSKHPPRYRTSSAYHITRMTDSTKPFPLLDLPPELIRRIYESSDDYNYSWPSTLSTGAYVCRALVPFTRDTRYSIIQLKGGQTPQAEFVRLLLDTPDIAASIQELGLIDVTTQPGSLRQTLVSDLARTWPTFTHLRVLHLVEADDWTHSLFVHAGTLTFPFLNTLHIESAFDFEGWTSPWDLDRWRPALAAAPNLKKLDLWLGQDVEVIYPRDPHDLTAASVELGPALVTRITALALKWAPTAHASAAQRFASAFPGLVHLYLHFAHHFPQPNVGHELQLPLLRTLSLVWELKHLDPDAKLKTLDLRTLPALEVLNFHWKGASIDFVFRLPPSIRIVCTNGVPLPGFIRLLEVHPDQLPALCRIKLDVPNGDSYVLKEGETVDDVINRGVRDHHRFGSQTIFDWVGYTPELLDELFRLAKQRGVEITGNVVHVHAYNQAKLAHRERRAARHALRLAAAQD